MNGWRCSLCKTTIMSRSNAVRHLRTVHRPAPHHRCNRCGHCMQSNYSLRRHKITCQTKGAFQRSFKHCHHHRIPKHSTLPKDYVPDEYLTYIKGDEKNIQHVRAAISELSRQEDDVHSIPATDSISSDGPPDLSDSDCFEYVIGNQCVRVARRENDSFEICIGDANGRNQWPCPRCNLPFRTPLGLATHLHYLYDGFHLKK